MAGLLLTMGVGFTSTTRAVQGALGRQGAASWAAALTPSTASGGCTSGWSRGCWGAPTLHAFLS